MSAPSSNQDDGGGGGPSPGGSPPEEEDLDSDVGTIFSDEEEGKKLSEDEEEEGGEGDGASDDDSGSSASSGSDEGAEKCPICLQRLTDQEVGSPEMCEHQFCLRCIVAWSKKVATCPIDRKFFSTIIVKKHWNGEVIRIEEVMFANSQNSDDQYFDIDPTFCEVCGRSDREDRLLLCDGCDSGYHMECLDPPLEHVPIEVWNCPTCVAQGITGANEEPEPAPAPVQPRRVRAQRTRIPRTRQNERILQSIDTIDPIELDNVVASVAAGVGLQFPPARPPRLSVTTRKPRTRKTKKRSGPRASTSARGAPKKRRSRRKTRKRRRVAVDKKPHTARGRIAHQLGIMPPLPGQVYVGLPPACRSSASTSSASTSGTSSAINSLRYSAGIAPLRMFGALNDLSDLVDSWSDEEGPIASTSRMGAVHQPFGASLKGPPDVVSPQPSTSTASCDVLGNILKKQYIFLNDRNVKIARDGTLVPSLSSMQLPNVMTTVSAKSSRSTVTSPSSSQPHTPSASPTRSGGGSPRITTCGLINGQETISPSRISCTVTQPTSDSVGCGGGGGDQSSAAEGSSGGNNHQGSSHLSQESQNTNYSGDFNLSEYWGSQYLSSQKIDDDDFDIYSDIEEQPQDSDKTDSVPASSSPPATTSFGVSALVGATATRRKPSHDSSQQEDHDSESEMVIDEEIAVKSAQAQAVARIPAKETELPPWDDATNKETIKEDQGQQDEGKIPESPMSIPLPPSPLHEIFREMEKKKAMPVTKITRRKTTVPRKVYDPSQPLESSDEDEQFRGNLMSINPSEDTGIRAKKQASSHPSKSFSCKAPDLSSIPMPPDDGRRPAIHFSIPKRHNLLSLSSLMKRQKGLTKKECKSDGTTLNLQSEISKVFGTIGSQDSEPRSEDDENLPKISLVAEIFGSDEDDDEEAVGEAGATASLPDAAIPPESQEDKATTEDIEPTSKPVDNAIDVTSGRWKTVSEEAVPEPTIPPPSSVPVVDTVAINDQAGKEDMETSQRRGSEDEPEIIEIVTLNVPPQPRRFMAGAHGVETISDTDDSDIEVIDEVQSAKGTAKENTSGSKESRSRSASPRRRQERKRRHSSSSGSFFEEGEIVDGSQKRRREKRRKMKKGRLNKDKGAKGSSGLKERNSAGADIHSNISSEDEGKAENDSVEWKKPKKTPEKRNERSLSYREMSLSTEKVLGASGSLHHQRSRRSPSPGKRASHSRYSKKLPRSESTGSWRRNRKNSVSSRGSGTSNKSPSKRHHHRSSVSPHPLAHSRSPSRSPEPIRPRSSHVPKGRTSRSRSRDRAHHRRLRRRSVSRSPSSVSRRRSKNARAAEALRLKRKAKLKKLSVASKTRRKPAKERLREREKRKTLESNSKSEEKLVKGKAKPPKERPEKRKKRREKSLSPVKAIVADGDSIVVSLSFQKETMDHSAKASSEKTSVSKTTKKSPTKRTPEGTKHKERSSTPKSPSAKKNLDLGTEDLSSNSESGSSDTSLVNREKETGASKVSSSGDGSGRPQQRYEPEKLYTGTATATAITKSIGKHDDSGEMQGDSLVTSTRDSLEPSALPEDDYANSATSPVHLKQASLETTKLPIPSVTSSAHSPRAQGGPTLPPQLPGVGQGPPPVANVNPNPTQKSSTAAEMQPTVAPIPPVSVPISQSQAMRYPPATSTNLLNPVLATVASALFAARHQAPPSATVVGDQLRGRTGTTPVKNPNSRSQGKRSNQMLFTGGDGSPVSPNSSEGDDLFEPPTDHGPGPSKKPGGQGKAPPTVGTMASLFDSLFGDPGKPAARPEVVKPYKPSKPQSNRPPYRKVAKKDPPPFHPCLPCDINLNEDVPASAVELSVQEKLLKKLNRQERVVEEVKLCLKPHYIKKHVDKEEYKEILRRAVPKVCHSKTGEINPFKIRELVDAYVRKFRHSRKF